MMDYPFAKFGDFSFSRFDFIVWTNRQTDRIAHYHTDADDRYNRATPIDVSKYTCTVVSRMQLL